MVFLDKSFFFFWTSSRESGDSVRAGPSGRLFREVRSVFGQFGVGCMMRAVNRVPLIAVGLWRRHLVGKSCG